VAVVGASRSKLSIGGLVFDNLLPGGFTGVVYPVNPHAPYVQGVAAYPSLSRLPRGPRPRRRVHPRPAGERRHRRGRRARRHGRLRRVGRVRRDRPRGRGALQEDLLERAHGYGLRIVGPNCMGLLNGNPDVRMNGTFSQTFPGPGRVSMSSQSGALGLAVLEHVDRLGLGISTFVSVGNKADISGNDLLLYWENDADTDVILLYLESFGNPRKFSRIARRHLAPASRSWR
jgi:acetate---CoA ligase (ADP-forming)